MAKESRTHIMSSGKQIHIYDGLIPAMLRADFYEYVQRSAFFIGWGDSDSQKALKHECLYTFYDGPQTLKAGILPFLQTTEVNEHIKGLDLTKSIVNMSVPTHSHFSHCHPEKIVVLYYVNLDWDQHWHGETLFYSEDLTEIDLAVQYTPGRVVVFDASIPHAIRPQSHSADHYRFTYTMTFEERAKPDTQHINR
jgi:hypothetical protein